MAAKKGTKKKKPVAKKSPAKKSPRKKSLPWDSPVVLLSTWFGLGRIGFASGTWGSLGTFLLVGFVYAVVDLENIFVALLVTTIAVFFLGMWAVEEYLKSTNKKDPSEVVIDEVAGQMLALTLITYGANNISTASVLFPYFIMFLLFRFFDIWKPWPCNMIDQKVKGALGVMLDDVFAAIYAVLMFYTLAMLMILVLASAGVLNP